MASCLQRWTEVASDSFPLFGGAPKPPQMNSVPWMEDLTGSQTCMASSLIPE